MNLKMISNMEKVRLDEHYDKYLDVIMQDTTQEMRQEIADLYFSVRMAKPKLSRKQIVRSKLFKATFSKFATNQGAKYILELLVSKHPDINRKVTAR